MTVVSSIKVKVIRRPQLKLKVLPRFPASVTTSSPILLANIGGSYQFSFDINAAASSLSGFFVSPSSVRTKLTANRTYYVRTDGNDSNTGLTNTSGGAFLTVQAAINTVAALDLQIYNVTIQIADGTYAGAMVVNGPWLGTGDVTIQGNNATPSNVVLST